MTHATKTVPLIAAALALLASAGAGSAAEWNPASYGDENTIELRTTAPGEAAHWFPVWIVVIDGQAYVRLGSRAAKRIRENRTAPYVGVRVAGKQFDRIKAEEAPEKTAAVAAAMRKKYWSDFLVRLFPHPLTMRLVAP